MMLLAVETSTILALLGVLLIFFAWARNGRRRTKLSNQLPVSRPTSTTPPADGHHLDAPAFVARWEVAMHETARDLMGRLDSKIVIVEQLVRDAQQAAARLESVLRQIEQANGRVAPSESAAAEPEAMSDAPSATANSAKPTDA